MTVPSLRQVATTAAAGEPWLRQSPGRADGTAPRATDDSSDPPTDRGSRAGLPSLRARP
jgi:hypothetical protein